MKQKKGTHSFLSWPGGMGRLGVLFVLVGWLGACSLGCDTTENENNDGNEPDKKVIQVSVLTEQQEIPWESQAVAPLSDGGFAMVWNKGEAPDRDVMMQWVDATGKPRQKNGALTINTGTGDACVNHVLARPEGGVFVAYYQEGGQGYHVKVRAYNKAMAAIWPYPVDASIYITYAAGIENQRMPILTADQAGGVYVTYVYENATGRKGIKCQRLSPTGTRQWGNDGITLAADCYTVSIPSVVPDDTGGVYVSWANCPEETENVALVAMHLNQAGEKTWGNTSRVISSDSRFISSGLYYYSIAVKAVPDGFNGFVLTWLGRYGDQMAQRMNANGEGLWGSGILIERRGGDHVPYLEEMIATKDGGAIVTTRISGWSESLDLKRLGPGGDNLWPNWYETNGYHVLSGYRLYGQYNGIDFNVMFSHFSSRSPSQVVNARFDKNGISTNPKGELIEETNFTQNSCGMVYNEVSKKYFVIWEDSRFSASQKREDITYDIFGAILKYTLSVSSEGVPVTF